MPIVNVSSATLLFPGTAGTYKAGVPAGGGDPTRIYFNVNFASVTEVVGSSISIRIGDATYSVPGAGDATDVNATYQIPIAPPMNGRLSLALPTLQGTLAGSIIRVTIPKIIIDTTPPVVANSGNFFSVPANGWYKAGKQISFAVKFSEPVVCGPNNSVQLKKTGGEVIGDMFVTSGSGTDTLVFSRTVAAGNDAATGVLTGDTIVSPAEDLTDVAGNPLASLAINAATLPNVIIDTVQPSMSIVVPTAKTYMVGDELIWTANYSEPVYISGQPTLPLVVGTQATFAAYHSGAGTTAIKFRYIVPINALDTDGITVSPTLLIRSGDGMGDKAGNVAIWSSGSTTGVKIDGVAPTTPTISLTTDTGKSDRDRITSNGEITVVCEEGATAEYSTDSAVWSALSPTLAEGKNQIFVRAKDAAGNVSRPRPFDVTLDTVQPATLSARLLVDTGSSGSDTITNKTAVLVLNNAMELGATLEFSINNGSTWIKTNPGDAIKTDGPKSVMVRQTDVAGNISTPVTAELIRDTTPPAMPTVTLETDTGRLATDLITKTDGLTVVATGGTAEYSVDGGMCWSSSFKGAEGRNSVVVRSVDTAGNPSPRKTFTFTLDTEAPLKPTIVMRKKGPLTIEAVGATVQANGYLGVFNVGDKFEITDVGNGDNLVWVSNDGSTWRLWDSIFVPQTGDSRLIYARLEDKAGNYSPTVSMPYKYTAPA